MALCDTCEFYRKKYDEFRQQYNDAIVDGGKQLKPHYCPIYDDHIPHDIFYVGADCPYYLKK